jgi:periplasmic protein TorT
LANQCRRGAVTSSEPTQGRSGKVEIAPTYFSHAAYRDTKRSRILAAPTDFPLLQGWLSVEMAVRALENRLVLTHAGPPILMVKSDTVYQTPADGSLAPDSLVPVFSLEAKRPTDKFP